MGECIFHSDRQVNMNLINMQKKSLSDYKAVIFDLDGTLYYQKPFRIRMLLYLIGYALAHPSGVKDIFLIQKYRQIRENWDEIEQKGSYREDMDLDSRQFAYVAGIKRVSPERVRNAVRLFMLEAPPKLLPAYRDDVIAALIDKLHEKGVKVVVYSDYPVKDKLEALAVKADACFTSADEAIGCMKPDPKGLGIILKTLGISAEEAIMIGDRYEKDGLAAKRNNMDYIIVSASKKERNKKDMLKLL